MDINIYWMHMHSMCSYSINYINKSNEGVSWILNKAISEVNIGNYSVKGNLKPAGHTFI